MTQDRVGGDAEYEVHAGMICRACLTPKAPHACLDMIESSPHPLLRFLLWAWGWTLSGLR